MSNDPSPIVLTVVIARTVFSKTEEYQLGRLTTIQVQYWYVAAEGEECILLGPTKKIPGNSSPPLTYEEARELANNIDKQSMNEKLIIKKQDNDCFQ